MIRSHLFAAAFAAAVLATPAAFAADNIELRPGARILFTDDAYAGVLSDAPQDLIGKPGAPASEGGGRTQAAQEAIWPVSRGDDLRDTIEQWAKQAGWEVFWNLPERDAYELGGNNVYRGSFQHAVENMISSMPAKIRIRIRLVPDNTPPMVYVEPLEERK